MVNREIRRWECTGTDYGRGTQCNVGLSNTNKRARVSLCTLVCPWLYKGVSTKAFRTDVRLMSSDLAYLYASGQILGSYENVLVRSSILRLAGHVFCIWNAIDLHVALLRVRIRSVLYIDIVHLSIFFKIYRYYGNREKQGRAVVYALHAIRIRIRLPSFILIGNLPNSEGVRIQCVTTPRSK